MMLHNRIIYAISIAFALIVAGGILSNLSKSVIQKNNNKHNISEETARSVRCALRKREDYRNPMNEILKTEENLRACYPQEWAEKPSYFEENYKILNANEAKIFDSLRNAEVHTEIKKQEIDSSQCGTYISKYRSQIVEYQSYKINLEKRKKEHDCP